MGSIKCFNKKQNHFIFQINFTFETIEVIMGFEYKLKTKLTDQQTAEIQDLLEKSVLFEKKYEYGHQLFWDFRHAENTGKIPNISIIFEEDGIYICQWSSSYLWKDLEELKNYLVKEHIEYDLIDYQE